MKKLFIFPIVFSVIGFFFIVKAKATTIDDLTALVDAISETVQYHNGTTTFMGGWSHFMMWNSENGTKNLYLTNGIPTCFAFTHATQTSQQYLIPSNTATTAIDCGLSSINNSSYHYVWDGDSWEISSPSGASSRLNRSQNINLNIISNLDIKFSYSGGTFNYGTAYDNIGTLTAGNTIFFANFELDRPIAYIPPSEKKRLEVKAVGYESDDLKIRIESNFECTLEDDETSTVIGGITYDYHQILCPEFGYNFYLCEGSVCTYVPTGTPYLLSDPDLCSNVLYSNYILYYQDSEELVCKNKNNPLVDQLFPIESVHSIDLDGIDFGAFGFLKPIFQFFVDVVNGIAAFFYDALRFIATLLIPDPLATDFFFADIVEKGNEKFSGIDLSGLDSLSDISPTPPSDLTVNWHGNTNTIISFDSLSDSRTSWAPWITGIFGLVLLVFNVNMVSRVLQDQDAI